MNRTIAPEFIKPDRLEIEFPTTIQLENGVTLFWISDVKDESVKLDIEWTAGSKYQDKKLVANFANKLLFSGNDKATSTEIAAEIDFYGGFLQHELDRDHAGFNLYGLKDNISNIFKVAMNAIMNCAYPTSEFEKERSVGLMRYKIESKKVKTICRRTFNESVFGKDSAYGQVADLSDFDHINREDVLAFYEAFYKKNIPTLFLVGNVDEAFIEDLRKWTAQLTPTAKSYTKSEFTQLKKRIDIPVDDAIQSAIRFGRLMFDKNHEDYFKFQLLNTVLGGYFGSRLMVNIREDKGYTYGIGSSMSVMEDGAYFFITTEVGVDVKEPTIQEIKDELKRLRTELIPEEELNRVKNYMLGDFLRHADGPIAMMENFKNIHFNRLKKTYYTDFIKAVNQATSDELLHIAQTYLGEDDLTLVTAG